MYGLCLGLVYPLLDEELLSEAAENPRRYSSNDGDAGQGSESLEGLPHRLVAWRYQAYGGQPRPSLHWFCSGSWDGKVRHRYCGQIVDTKIR